MVLMSKSAYHDLASIIIELIALQSSATGTQPEPRMRELMESAAPTALANLFQGRTTTGSTGFGSRAHVPWFGFDRRDVGLWLVFLFPADREAACLTLMLNGESFGANLDAIRTAADDLRFRLFREAGVSPLRLGANTHRARTYEAGFLRFQEIRLTDVSPETLDSTLSQYVSYLDDAVESAINGRESDALSPTEQPQDRGTEKTTSGTHVDIRPGVSAISAYRYMDTNEWYALAELVDNSISSWMSHREQLKDPKTGKSALTVSIRFDNVDGGRIKVWDNAAGINTAEFQRAFKPGSPPDDRTALSRYGLGMKMASIWFADNWKVTTTAFNEEITRTIEFDVPRIIETDQELVFPMERPRGQRDHGTEIVLWNLRKVPVGSTLGKMKRHLAEMYRGFIRTGDVEILWNGDPLEYETPTVLLAPIHSDGANGEPIQWAKKFVIDVPDSDSISGRAVLFARGKQAEAGLNLFWRGRLIKGNLDPQYKPAHIFGSGNSFRAQRLQVELDLDSFTPTFDKKDFVWNACPMIEDDLLTLLKEALDSEPLPLLSQADNYRSGELEPAAKSAAGEAAAAVAGVVERKAAPEIERQIAQPSPSEDVLPEPQRKSYSQTEKLIISIGNQKWRILINLSDRGEDRSEWLDITDRPAKSTADGVRHLGIRISLSNPFTVRFGNNRASMDILMRMAAGIAIAEITAREARDAAPGAIRRNLNDLLLNVLSET
jgi:hypothetical protein